MGNGLAFIAGMVFGGLVGAFLAILLVGFCIHLTRGDYYEDDNFNEEQHGN